MTVQAARIRPESSYWRSRARIFAIKSVLRGAVLALLLAAWQLLAQRSGVLGVPSVTATLEATWTLLADGSLIRGLAVTNEAMVIGYVVSLVISLPLGLAMGLRPAVKRLLEPYMTILIALPMIAVLPVVQVMFGLTLTSRVVVVVLFAFTYMTVNTMVGVETVDDRLREMSRSFEASWWQTMRKVVLPGATPAIIAGARLGLGRAIMGMIVAELLLVSPGIGSMILDYQASFEPPFVFAILLVAVLEGVVLMQLAAGVVVTPQRKRAAEAWELPGACRFSDDSELRNPEWIVREIQRHPEIWDDLWRETTDPATLERLETGRKHVVGRNRLDGHWALIASAWLLARNPDIQLFYDHHLTSSLWRAAGFQTVPSARTTHERLRELELFTPGFLTVKQKLWRHAMQLDTRIGRHIHVDATATSAHARLHHACTDRERCKALGGRPPQVIERLEGDEADGQRHREAEKSPEEVEREQAEWQKRNAPPETDDDIEDEAVELAATETSAEDAAAAPRHPKYDYERPRRDASSSEPNEIFIAGHRYVCLDHDAGFRIYQIKSGRKVKAWLGGLKLTATDDYTGAKIASLHIRADQAEHQHYAELLERVRDVLGCYPEVVVCDRHYTVRHVRELNERLGIGDVIPFRKPNQSVTKRSQLAIEGVVDEYGIPQCDYCGSPGAKLRHVRKRDKGYVRFVCANPHTPECSSKVQSRPCSVQPYLLGALSRDTELYFALRTQGKVKEMVHRHQRARYAVGGNNVDTRPKMRGFGVLELRALIAEFLEIFRVSLRQGWLKSRAKLNKITPRKRDGSRALEGFKRLRKIKKLLLPRGPAAVKLGLVFQGELPPGWPARDRNGRSPTAKRRGKAPPEPPPDDVPF